MKRRFEDLEAWKHAREFRKEIYRITKSFPKDELFGLVTQMRRSAGSITANIAEGYGRYSYPEVIQFCVIARGSLNETIDQLYVALDESYIDQTIFDKLYDMGRVTEIILNGYINHLKKSQKTSS
jgi:four helix bundle protein